MVTILKNMFPAGVKRESQRVVTFKLCEGDYISVRHHVFVKTAYNSVELAEVGPRMEMKVSRLITRSCISLCFALFGSG